MRWLAAVAAIVALGLALSIIRIDHYIGHVEFKAKVEISSASVSTRGIAVELVHHHGGSWGHPQTDRRFVCVTDAAGKCEGELAFNFEGERFHLRNAWEWPRASWQVRLVANDRELATRPLPAGRGYLFGVPYFLRISL